jgi:hypothetical protein
MLYELDPLADVDTLGEALQELEPLPDALGERLDDGEVVSEPEILPEALGDGLEDGEELPLRVSVLVAVTVGLGLIERVIVTVREAVTEEVDAGDAVEDRVREEVLVLVAVPVVEGVGAPLVGLRVMVAVRDCVGSGVSLDDAVSEPEGELEGVSLPLAEGVAGTLIVPDTDGNADTSAPAECDTEAVLLRVGVLDGVMDGLFVLEGEMDFDLVSDEDGVTAGSNAVIRMPANPVAATNVMPPLDVKPPPTVSKLDGSVPTESELYMLAEPLDVRIAKA